MRRRSTKSKPTKTPVHTIKRKPGRARIARLSSSDLQKQLGQRTRERDEALEQQAATAEVLKVISRSTFDLQAVLDTLVESAARLCEADMVGLNRPRDGAMHFSANFGLPREFEEIAKRAPFVPGRGTVVGRVLLAGKPVQMPDVEADPEYTFTEGQKAGGFRTVLGVPLEREGETIGVIVLIRAKVRPFTDKQIELAQNFAAQAVIAIENARLLSELRQSLQQQTATADVLKVISRSTFDLKVVLNTLIESAARLCEADMASIPRVTGTSIDVVATYGYSSAFEEFARRNPTSPGRATVSGRAVLEGRTVHIPDVLADPEYDYGQGEGQKVGGFRTLLGVPLLREGVAIGALVLARSMARPFTSQQIDLATTFADQAVIAIENVRLFEAEQQRTRELTESLEQQIATSDVLKVISSSPGELEPVFESILANATNLCAAKFANLYLCEGDAFRTAAMHNAPPAFAEARKRNPLVHIGPNTALGRIVATRKAINIPDGTLEQAYIERHPLFVSAIELGGFRAFLGVPMIKENKLIGAIMIYRQEVGAFSDKQVALVQNFANQAVIAIENARLLNELRESLQQQTATSEILDVIGNSPTDSQPAFEAIVRSGLRLFPDAAIMIGLPDGKFVSGAAIADADSASAAALRARLPLPLSREFITSAAILDRREIDLADARDAPPEMAAGARNFLASGYRAITVMPMMRGDTAIGAVNVMHRQPVQLSEKQRELLRTFANQAVIAIENTRLFSELRQRTDDLTESLQQQTATADVLKAISRSTFDLNTVLQTLVEAAARLCEADQGTIAREQEGVFVRAATYGFSAEFTDYVTHLPVERERGSATGRALLEGRTVHIQDVQSDPDYTFSKAKELGGFRTILAVPMLRDGAAIGVLALTRIDVHPFTEKQIDLVTTFADQAAIAIENVRLFESAEARTRELAKSLEELRTAQDRLVQTQKLASLGQLTAGIAHEIKNPLNFVNNFSGVSAELVDELRQALERVTTDGQTQAELTELIDTLHGNLQKIVRHGKRADSIVKNMLLHSREGSGEHRLVDINVVVEDSLNLAYHGARAEKQGFNITLERSFDPAAGEVDLFPQEMTRVFLNLISNGFYAATKRKAESNDETYEPILSATTKNLGDRVEIRIRDNGIGIPPEVRERLFNPFFTTKPVGEGTGLGLSISHDIVVKQHAGVIEVESRPGEFTEFRIVLPRTAAFIAKTGGRA